MCSKAPGGPRSLFRSRRVACLSVSFVLAAWALGPPAVGAAALPEPNAPPPESLAAADGLEALDGLDAVLPAEGDPNAAPPPGGAELLLFQDVPVVVSASRRADRANWLSVPVSVVTAEDIHYSGLTTLPEVLQFVPGMDVLQMHRGLYAVGVRGLHEKYSNRMLPMIEGRAADSPVHGGPTFLLWPVLPEDIKRIEVVRGPAGAAWGGSALNGVINIIPKDPKDVLGWFASTTWDHYGDSFSHVRWAAESGPWSWMVSAGYRDVESSDDAIDDDGFASKDFVRNWRFDGRAVYQASPQTRWLSGLGYSHAEEGEPIAGDISSVDNARVGQARAFTKLETTRPDGSGGFLQWYGNFTHVRYPAQLKECERENQVEGQWQFAPWKGHAVTVGGNFRWTMLVANIPSRPDAYRFAGLPAHEFRAGLFAIDRWEIGPRLTLEGQLRGDWYSQTHADWAARATALYALDDRKDRTLRFSIARSFREPRIGLRGGHLKTVPHPFVPGLFLVNILAPGRSLRNENTWAIEGGYTHKLADWLTFASNLYYQRYERVIGFKVLPDPLAAGRLMMRADNLDGADAYGGEAELTATAEFGKFRAWYAFNGFCEERDHQDVRAYLPAQHKFGLGARVFLPWDCTLNVNYRYATSTSGAHMGVLNTETIAENHRLDVTVAKKLLDGRAELMIGVTDLLNRTNDPVLSVGQTSAFETPGRTFFVRFQVKF